jgi:HK97 family phage major capsid protein
VTWEAAGKATLLGYPVAFSSQVPVYAASPAVSGAILFGDFKAAAVIGDRGGSAIRAKVLDQPAALNGQTIVLGYRRTDQRIRLQEAIQIMTVTG